ncbi:ribonuclease H-like protein [Piromyces finnis]|uniref:Ribonuclease H-like protein n=1 Tax=Piromyces finnis TaxID=1754191 RepID=A0A1Y1UN74_9FUNG|nr:ribonuclease H-like protein [Piromyces finnis]|eukprot:ORX39501.1 ribonuclease H-like protein [Piromyces finnis]
MSKKVLEENLIVWIDCEMTGLDLDKDHIIEIACIVTDKDLNILDEAPDIIINFPEEVITSMNEWSWEHHTKSGLVDAMRQSKISLEEADTIISKFIGKHFPNKCSAILAGNSVHVDKKFLEKDFPKTFEYFHYRIIDVSTIKEITRRWYPEIFSKLPTFQNLHRALDDIRGSIKELNYYREMVFKHKLNPSATEFVPSTSYNNNNNNNNISNNNNSQNPNPYINNNKNAGYRKNDTVYYNNNNINNSSMVRPMHPNNNYPYYNKDYRPNYNHGGNTYNNNSNNNYNNNNNNNNYYSKKYYNRPPKQYNGPNPNPNSSS